MDDDTQPAGRGSTPGISTVDLGERYELREALGRGGMGEVRLARDLQIERDVAVKLMHPEQRDEATIARFFREARVQGQLEHPAVVPVHDLGIDRNGNPYFVMKRLAGTTLAHVLAAPTSALRHQKWSRRQLLSRLVDVCFAVEFAHARGIVHRDLKPANIMLGDFNEAFVLDWGLARVVGDSQRVAAPLPPDASFEVGATVPGQILGTPGYMAPEQIAGDADARSDVFALGAILFEILAGEPAMPPGFAALETTLEAPCHRPSERAPTKDIPLELDDLCARATAQDRADRPTARELAAGIQAYLDGDRDHERRRELSVEHAARATAAFRESLDEARALAMREAGRAFALDPTNATAQALLGRLLLEAPSELPAEAVAAANLERGRTRQKVVRWATKVFAVMTPLPLVLFFAEVRHAWPIIAMSVICGAISVTCWAASRDVIPPRSPWFLAVLALDLALLVITGVIFGPLLSLPMFLIGSLAAWLLQPGPREIGIIIAAHVLAFVPLVLCEASGITPATFRIADGGLVLTPYALELTPLTATVILGLSLVSQFINTTFIALTGLRAQESARDQVHAQTWHLQQLISRDDPPAK